MNDCRLALFIDFENIARGVRQRHLEERVDLQAILAELEAKGRILVKRAYADWGYYKDYRSDLLQNGIDPVQVFAAARDREGWKNGADIRIAIEAIESVFRFPEITDFVLVSGDSDFLSLVTRLRENGKTVWGVGLKSSSSQYLVKSCDHYLFYEDIAEWLPDEHTDQANGSRRDARALLLTTVRRMSDRQGLPGMPPPGTPLKAGAVKAAMRRLDPAWDEQFEGYGSFLEFLQAHQDVILYGRPGDGLEFYLAEKGTIAETNLQRMLGIAQGPAAEPLSRDECVDQVRRALRVLGTTDPTAETPQRTPVRGTQLKIRLRQQVPSFDESAYGCPSFLDFLLTMREQFRVARSEIRGDVLVAERGSPAEATLTALPEAVAGNGHHAWAQTPEQRYMGALRVRRIRHVPMQDRYAIIQALCRIFDEARERGEELSLKEAKDRLHEWFEENRPTVPWDSVNNVVYHLFWTYCFEFEDAEEDVPLWDRPTRWHGGMQTFEEIVRRCDSGLVRMISEVVGNVDAQVILQVLGDGDGERLSFFEEVCEQVNARLPVGGRT
ncbi:MAG TPA: NYN domain-containing protein [Armatimonadota bacterium]|nr:NYN domain-containing protein [Armatimonadota bacterium]